MIQKTYRLWVASLLTLCSASAAAQQKVEILPFGNMDQWVTREIKESGIIGGNTKKVYRQLKENPLAEVCAMHPDGTWIRINGNVMWDDSREAKVAMLEQNPDLRSMYSEDDGKMEVFYLGGGSVTIDSFTAPQESMAL